MITNKIHQRPFGKHFMIVRISQFVAMVTFLAFTSAHAHQLLDFLRMTVWTF